MNSIIARADRNADAIDKKAIEQVANDLASVQSFDPWSAKAISEANKMLRKLAAERDH